MGETYYCAKQYRIALAVYLITIILLTLNISIEKEIDAPDHGKYVVDGTNERNKSYLMEKLIGYQKFSPQPVKPLGCLVMPLTNQLLFCRTI